MTTAVVVGGGVIGACCALELRDAGIEHVTLLEAGGALGAQTTAAGAGFAAYWAGALEATLADYATGFYARVQEQDGTDLGVRRRGLLLPALSEAGEAVLRGLHEREHAFSDEVRWLEPAEALALAPILAPGAVRGAVLQPQAHQVPTARTMEALARRLPAAGVDVRLGARVERVERSGDRVAGVRTADGLLAADVVVNAAGAWAHALAARDGVSVGAVPLLESRFVTAPSPEVSDELPLLLLLERDVLYVRPEQGGLLVGAVERSVPAASRPPLDAPPDVAELPDHAVASHERLARESADVLPLLGRLRPLARASGMPTFTPDGRHVLGEAPDLRGYYVAAGCNESGVTHGPGLAHLLAELVTTGTTRDDVSPYRVGRFAELSDAELCDGAVATYLSRHVSQPTTDGGAR
ncbi:MAG TPA: FAD-binding oxidoreductase [Conexibacter sp.]|jgi:sarcosine oxidase subunit beta|nr:FAD-binding oxidoreductase [Conexibacter sp.]